MKRGKDDARSRDDGVGIGRSRDGDRLGVHAALLGLIIAAAVVFVRWLWERAGPIPRGDGGQSALEILKRRYARGEIDREEFEAKKQDLA